MSLHQLSPLIPREGVCKGGSINLGKEMARPPPSPHATCYLTYRSVSRVWWPDPPCSPHLPSPPLPPPTPRRPGPCRQGDGLPGARGGRAAGRRQPGPRPGPRAAALLVWVMGHVAALGGRQSTKQCGISPRTQGNHDKGMPRAVTGQTLCPRPPPPWWGGGAVRR